MKILLKHRKKLEKYNVIIAWYANRLPRKMPESDKSKLIYYFSKWVLTNLDKPVNKPADELVDKP